MSLAGAARALILAIAVAVPLAGASELPDLGDASRALLSSAQERRLGNEVMREVRADRTFFDDAELTAYLGNLGYRLLSSSPDSRISFEFFVMQDVAVNAFALPGGYIGVHTGLMATAQTESELAAVIAHEIAHVTQGHIARLVSGQQQAQVGSIVAMAIALLAARSNPQLAQGAIVGAQAAFVQSQLNFTRDMEREADRLGLVILERAGFDVRGMSSFFERLQRSTRALDSTAPAYLRTHPMTTERIADALNRIDALPYRQVRDDPEFQFIRARLRAAQGPAREAVQIFDSGLRQRAFSNEAAQRYGLIVALMRTREYARAQVELKALRAMGPTLALVDALEGDLLLASGNLKSAATFYPAALGNHPRYRPLVYDYADVLIKLDRAGDALKLATDHLQYFPSDHRLYFIQARAYASLGRGLAQGRAQAEANVLLGNLGLAIEQLQNGLKAADGDFFELSASEARLRELRALQAASKKV
ncbi:MAG: M48 family metallopeptidase [Proteobacteria bacterium]|nr:M48 family metallopeptidase [Burkholderiales bacterium]